MKGSDLSLSENALDWISLWMAVHAIEGNFIDFEQATKDYFSMLTRQCDKFLDTEKEKD